MDVQILLLHGLRANTFTLQLLKTILHFYGWSNIHALPYDVNLEIEENLQYIDEELQKHFDKNKPLVCIGQSMGGIYSMKLHTTGWNVIYVVTIGSPLGGAKLLNQLQEILPTTVTDYFHSRRKNPYNFLMNCGKLNEPPHPTL